MKYIGLILLCSPRKLFAAQDWPRPSWKSRLAIANGLASKTRWALGRDFRRLSGVEG